KYVYKVGEPIMITVGAVNHGDRVVPLYPESTYPSLFDFYIHDNGTPLQYTLNMARNLHGAKVDIQTNVVMFWVTEDIALHTANKDRESTFKNKGKHVISFGIGEPVTIEIK
ncbi:MAG: hypothetical protein AAB116_09410, partial [Candidatus Poribacteria bacterium]